MGVRANTQHLMKICIFECKGEAQVRNISNDFNNTELFQCLYWSLNSR